LVSRPTGQEALLEGSRAAGGRPFREAGQAPVDRARKPVDQLVDENLAVSSAGSAKTSSINFLLSAISRYPPHA